MHFVYCTTCLLTYQHYIGVHTQDNPYEFDGYLGSGIWRGKKRYLNKMSLNEAIKEYGRENFTRSVIAVFETEKEAYDYETKLVTSEFIKHPWNFNLSIGGRGGWTSVNERLSKDPKHLKVLSDRAKKTFTNVAKSEEQKIKLSLSNIGKHAHLIGEGNPMFNKHHTEESRKNISKNMKGRSFCIWYTNGIDNIYQLKSLETPIGYRRGRTLNKDITTGRVV